jgi:hypothetical protein
MKTRNERIFTKNILFCWLSKILEKVFVNIVNFQIYKKFFDFEEKNKIVKNWQIF